MGIIRTDIAENFFSAQQTASGKLSILVGMDSFCYGIYNADGQLVFLRRLEFPDASVFSIDLAALERENPLLFFPYSRVCLAFGAPAHVFVPSRLFNPPSARVYLEHGNRIGASDRVCTALVQEINAHIVFALPHLLDTWLLRNFPGVPALHLSQVLLQHVLAASSTGKQVLAHFWDRRLILFFFDENRLVFENWFVCRDSRDFLYYLLLVFDRFQLDQENQEVLLSGTILADSNVFRLLNRYIRKLRFSALGAPLAYGKKMSSQPPHFFNDLNAIVQYR